GHLERGVQRSGRAPDHPAHPRAPRRRGAPLARALQDAGGGPHVISRRLVAGLLVALLVCAAGLASAHGHLDADHPQTCATCTLAPARAEVAAPPALPLLPPLAVALPHPTAPSATPEARPPLETAPKHGPPSFS